MRPLSLSLLFLFFCASFAALPAAAQDILVVDVAKTVRPVDKRFAGLNLDYALDGWRLNPDSDNSLAGTLKEMKPKFLRYPGGEISDGVLWAKAPYQTPEPTLVRDAAKSWPGQKIVAEDGATFAHPPLDFDAFIKLCRDTGAEPIAVVPLDAAFHSGVAGWNPPSRQQLKDAAVAWVTYANVTKKYGVKYWELGNESYLDGHVGASAYADAVVEFSQAMKKADPTLLIGANAGPLAPDAPAPTKPKSDGDEEPAPPPAESDTWFRTLLERAAKHIDYLALRAVPRDPWMDYEFYRTREEEVALDTAIALAESSLERYAPSEAPRIRLMVAAANASDWDMPGDSVPKWPHVNDLGHAIVLADMMGQILLHKTADAALVLATRDAVEDAVPVSAFAALNKHNRLNASGLVAAMWGNYLENTVIQTGKAFRVAAYASYSRDTHEVKVWLINKDKAYRQIDVQIKNYYVSDYDIDTWVLSGTGPEDPNPVFVKRDSDKLHSAQHNLILDPTSITILAIRP